MYTINKSVLSNILLMLILISLIRIPLVFIWKVLYYQVLKGGKDAVVIATTAAVEDIIIKTIKWSTYFSYSLDTKISKNLNNSKGLNLKPKMLEQLKSLLGITFNKPIVLLFLFLVFVTFFSNCFYKYHYLVLYIIS